MSSTYSAASVASLSDSSGPECKRPHSVKSIRSVGECSRSDGQAHGFTVTCDTSPRNDSPQTELPLTSLPVASLVRKSHTLESVEECKAAARAYGATTPELLARFDHSSLSWKTSQLCLIEGLATFSEIWPRSGMMRSGIAYQLRPLVPLINGIGCGLWPTPNAGAGRGGPDFAHRKRVKSISLQTAVQIWPTPAARDYRYPNKKPYSERGGGKQGEQLPNAVGGPLNPTWVEWLMGFPLGWTDLKRSGMRSSRRWRK